MTLLSTHDLALSWRLRLQLDGKESSSPNSIWAICCFSSSGHSSSFGPLTVPSMQELASLFLTSGSTFIHISSKTNRINSIDSNIDWVSLGQLLANCLQDFCSVCSCQYNNLCFISHPTRLPHYVPQRVRFPS